MDTVSPIALAKITWKYYILFIFIDAIELAIAYFIIVETKGLTLEEIALLFDGSETVLSPNHPRNPGVVNTLGSAGDIEMKHDETLQRENVI